MRRFAIAALAVFLLWALVPGAGELFENAVHLVQEGHSAHAAADGDHHDPMGPEHCCTGVVHLCSCCASVTALPICSANVVTNRNPGGVFAFGATNVSVVSGPRIFRPPQSLTPLDDV